MSRDGRTDDDFLPLTPMQRGMLFHHVRSPRSGVEILQVVGDLAEAIDAAIFRRAVAALQAAHEAFRLVFRWGDVEDPQMRLLAPEDVPVEVEERDLRGVAGVETFLSRFLVEDRRRGFDLARPPLSRFSLFRLPGERTRLVWTHHHAVIDGRSGRFVIEDLMEAYDALRAGRDPAPPERLPFSAHALAVAGLDPEPAERELRPLFAGLAELSPAPLAAPARSANAEADSPDLFGHGTIEHRLSPETTAAIREATAREGLGASTYAQAALSLVVARATGLDDLVVGQVRSGRYLVDGARQAIGNFINTAPIRARLEEATTVSAFLRGIAAFVRAFRDHEQVPLRRIQEWTDLPTGAALFDTALIFDTYRLESAFVGRGEGWAGRVFHLVDQTSVPLAFYFYDEPRISLRLSFDRVRYDEATASRLVAQFEQAIAALAAPGDRLLGEVEILPEDERRLILRLGEGPGGNSRAASVMDLFRARVQADPDREALVSGNERMSYAALARRVTSIAASLAGAGVVPGDRVAVLHERSVDLPALLLAILDVGAAYLPLDPDYPAERLAFMLTDARPSLLVTSRGLEDRLKEARTPRLTLTTVGDAQVEGRGTSPSAAVSPDAPAYLLYTSGSTGRPKGVVVRHRNLSEFFAGIDLVLPPPDGVETGRFLAVTSISFDISALEIFWSLTRGLTVVLQGETETHFGDLVRPPSKVPEFSLFYFAGAASAKAGERYRLLIDGARRADEEGFAAIWTPERHFHDFGGLYPNPSVIGAALATVTRSVALRGGSVVLPLQDPIRVAEEWSVVDNLSGGRAGVSFASGWHAQDFVLAAEHYPARVPLMYAGIDQVRRFWRGEGLRRRDGAGRDVEVFLHPRPVQPELPFWVTSGGHPDTFRSAGRIGANLLTHLLGQDLTALAEKIAIYRAARADAGLDPSTGKVTLMVHAFLGESRDEVRRIVKEPLIRYLATSSDLVRSLARSLGQLDREGSFSPTEEAEFLERRFDRYFEGLGLFGTVEDGEAFVDRLVALGVDEVACLVDFGVSHADAMRGIDRIAALRRRLMERASGRQRSSPSLAENLVREKISHLQCTPSLARMMLADAPTREALGGLEHWLVGGESFPPSLLAAIRETTRARVLNMYGPTETTIWSACHEPVPGEVPVPIGRALRRQSLRIVDARGGLVPLGAVGELAIGGVGVAAGYFERPELDAARFVADPFSRALGARLYRTGDMARFRADGLVEIMGRNDSQVKWRGHRIELGEIESALTAIEGIREAAVILRRDEGSEDRLCAYYRPASEAAPDESSLRSSLRQRLPEIMIPQDFVRLAAMPLTPNGKIDRRALPRPERGSDATSRRIVAPVGETETRLLEQWRRLLHRQEISVEDDWFELGGHSLLAIQLVAAVRNELGVGLDLARLFAAPTVRRLAGVIDAERLLGLSDSDLAALLEDLADGDRPKA